MNTLRRRLRECKLSGIYNSLEERLSFAQEKKLSYLEFLELLFEDEENNRRDNNYRKRQAKARLPYHKTVEEFDFAFQPSIDKRLVNDCATCQFVTDKKNLVFLGNPGTGKTHLAIAIGLKALLKGHKVLFTPVAEMLHHLHVSKADNSFYQKLAQYCAPDLLILDELGFKKLPAYSADDFFEVVSRRYEKGSVIITSNKAFDQWGDIFADQVLASAILDRVMHHSIIMKISGPSYRTKELKKKGGES